jgi:hypothetical protein
MHQGRYEMTWAMWIRIICPSHISQFKKKKVRHILISHTVQELPSKTHN